jgi:hypothetical protein
MINRQNAINPFGSAYTCYIKTILGAFAKLRNGTIIFIAINPFGSAYTLDQNHLRRIRKITKRDYYLCHVCQPSVCPSVWNNPASNVRTFMTFNESISRKSDEKIQVHYNLARITGTSHEDMYNWYLT